MLENKPKQLALFIILTSLCLAIQLTPRPPNVEFTSLFTFLVGVLWGVVVGVVFGAFVMFVNAFLSPWGYAGLNMPFQVVGIAIIGIVGGLYGRFTIEEDFVRRGYETAILGAFSTLIYDLITNFGVAFSYILAGVDPALAVFTSLSAGAIFSLIHIGSNVVVFGALSTPLLLTFRKLIGGEVSRYWKKEPFS